MANESPILESSEGSRADLNAFSPSHTGIIPLRAILIGLLLGPVCCYWAQAQPVDRIFSLMVPPVILTLLMVIINIPLRLYAPRMALSQGELIVIYGMQAVMCAMASEWIDNTQPFIYGYGVFHNDDSRHYVLPYISHWLYFLNDRGPMQGFAEGGKSNAYFWAHLGPWWPKILAWSLISGVIAFAMLCINALMLEQWADREKLSFPLVQLPLAMTEGGGSSAFWRDRLMWGCFAVMFGIDIYNGFAYFLPSLPLFNVRFLGDLSLYFPSPPWNAIGWTPIGIFPFIAAIGIFMPADLLFSLLFFFFFRKAEQVIAASMGFPEGVFGGGGLVPSAPYFTEQSWGAFLGLFAGAMWAARPYLKEKWQQIKHGAQRGAPDLPPRFAFGGLCASVIFMGIIGVALGMPFLYVALYVLLFLIFSTALSRLQAQIGAPTHEMAFMGPNQLFTDFHGTQGVEPALIARTVTTFYFMNRIQRTNPMPTQLEALYMADRRKINPRGIFAALLLATVIGSLLGYLTITYINYHLVPPDASDNTASVVRTLVQTPQGPNGAAISATVIGFAVVLLLDALRFQIPGFPLHPAGFALAMNFGVDYYWFGLLLAFIAKTSTLRYMGLKGFERLRMIAFGIMLGEFCAEAIWATFSMLHHNQPTYTISINGKLGWNV